MKENFPQTFPKVKRELATYEQIGPVVADKLGVERRTPE
jgi:hypothetical protein